MTAHFKFSGIPSHGVLPGYDQAAGIAMDLVPALAPLKAGPQCAQWCLIEKPKDKPYAANHPPRWVAAISHLVRGEHNLSISRSEFMLGMQPAMNLAQVEFMQPTIFVKAPCLYVYDVTTDDVSETDTLTIFQYFELPDGEQSLRAIDVVANGSLRAFAARYREVQANFARLIGERGSELLKLSRAQREKYQRDRIEEALDQAGRRLYPPYPG